MGSYHPESPAEWAMRWLTSMFSLPFAANSGQYVATLPWRSSSPRSARINAHSAVIVFVVDQTLTIVSRSHGFVLASSA